MNDFINEICACKDSQKIRSAIAILANRLNKQLKPCEKKALKKELHKTLLGKHFDKRTADECIKRMYCITKSNAVLHAPFLPDRASAELYERYKAQIKDYNVYDFMVVLNNVIANHYNLLRGWWKNEEWSVLLIKFSEIAVNWLNDDDTPYRGEKAWCVLGV